MIKHHCVSLWGTMRPFESIIMWNIFTVLWFPWLPLTAVTVYQWSFQDVLVHVSLRFLTLSPLSCLPSGEAGAAICPELQTDIYVGGWLDPDPQHQGAVIQICERTWTSQWWLGKSQEVRIHHQIQNLINIPTAAPVAMFLKYILCLQGDDSFSWGLWEPFKPGHWEKCLPGEWAGWEGVSPGFCAETERWSTRYRTYQSVFCEHRVGDGGQVYELRSYLFQIWDRSWRYERGIPTGCQHPAHLL